MRQRKKKNDKNERQGSTMDTLSKPLAQAGLLTAASLLSASAFAYTAVENRTLDADNLRSLSIRTYSGPLSITRSNSKNIEVEVVIDFDSEWEDDEARDALEDGLVFTLERRGTRAEIESWVGDYDEDGDFSFFTWGLIDLFRSGKNRPFSHLEVKVPDGLDLSINDYRGEVTIFNITGDIELRTGAGPVSITDIRGDLKLEDGAGEILVTNVTGDVEIRDGAGEMEVESIGGELTIHDGAGEIEVTTVGGYLDIRDGGGRIRVSDLKGSREIYDGAGEIDVRGVMGSIAFTDGGGGIDVSDVEKDVIVHSRGGGGFNTRNIRGEVIDASASRRNYRENYNDNYRYRYRDRERDIDIDEDIDIDIDIDVD